MYFQVWMYFSSVNCMVYIGFYKSFRQAILSFKNRRQSDTTVTEDMMKTSRIEFQDPVAKISFFWINSVEKWCILEEKTTSASKWCWWLRCGGENCIVCSTLRENCHLCIKGHLFYLFEVEQTRAASTMPHNVKNVALKICRKVASESHSLFR